MKKAKLLDQKEVNAYVRKHGINLPNGQVHLTEPLFVFKRAHVGYGSDLAIVNLVIPAGAVVNLAQNSTCKMRASQAYCYSVVDKSTRKGIASAVSSWNSSLRYRSAKTDGRLTLNDFKNIVADAEMYQPNWTKKRGLEHCKVRPNNFDITTSECSNGIHFFAQLERALAY